MNAKKSLRDVAVFAGCIAAMFGLGWIEVKLEEKKDFIRLMDSTERTIKANRALQRLQEERRNEMLVKLAEESKKSEEEA